MPETAMQTVVACELGQVDYAPARTLQKRLQERLICTKRSGAESPVDVPHVLLLVEHPPVYTLGKSGDEAHLLLSEASLSEHGATFHRVGRGGDITFHGPGQLVAYPLLDLDRFERDLHRYLRTLEAVVIQTCAAFGLKGRRVEGRTGVWIGPDARGPERKVCAMGVRCSRWVTMHGLALNVNTDLRFFDHIVPCGIADRGVTSIARELAEETGRPANGRADKPTADKPTADKPTADKPTADKPTADKPTADKPTADKSVDEEATRAHFLEAFAENVGAELSVKRGGAARAFLRSFLADDPEALPALLQPAAA